MGSTGSTGTTAKAAIGSRAKTKSRFPMATTSYVAAKPSTTKFPNVAARATATTSYHAAKTTTTPYVAAKPSTRKFTNLAARAMATTP